MKFSNGCWLSKEGVTPFSPAEAYQIQTQENWVKIVAPHTPIRHRGDTLKGPVITIELSSPMNDVIKVKAYHFKGLNDFGPHFEILENPAATVNILQDETILNFTAGNLTAKVDKNNWSLKFFNQDQLLTGSTSRNMAYIETEEDGTFMRDQLNLSVGELVYGLGEHFTPFIKNGQTVDIWNEDGGTSTEQSYKNIPFYLTNKGYGVFVNHPEKVSFEVGSEKVTRVQFSVPGEVLEYYIILGPTPKEILTKYTSLTGKPGLPPSWSFGLWLTTSFTTNYDEATVNQFVDGMADRGIPLHTFHFDCFWMKAYSWCDFQWDPEVFPDPVNMLKRLKAKGLKICVWINPYIGQESILFDEGMAGGYLLKRPNGDVWQWDMWQPGMAIVDFTNPAACEWFASKLQALVDMGVDSFKTDFGERIPTDVVYYNKANPYGMHNYYTFLYNKVVYDVLTKNYGADQAALFARSATVGGQQFPVHWGGDCTSDFESMSESLRGGLSLSLSGFGFWSHDIGGFESTSTADVYKRWCAFGLLSSHSRLHGSSSYRVPWLYDEESVEVVRAFSELKCSLMPYIFSTACQTAQTGIPTMRAMVLEFPEDRACHFLDQQYMLGDNLLVAPIFNEEGTSLTYLPKGNWTHFLSNEVISGGSYVEGQYDYFSLPLLARPNSVIPVGANNKRPDYDYTDNVTFHAFELAENAPIYAPIYSGRETIVAALEIVKVENTITLTFTGNSASSSVLLRNITKPVTVVGGIATLESTGTRIVPVNGQTTVQVTL